MTLDQLSLLYVEDEVEIRTLMRELLEDEVKVLYVASNGVEGLEMYEKYKPDIVLSDVYMPKMDGLHMSQTIKENFPQQAILLLTAFNNQEHRQNAIEIGIDAFINKPIQSQEQLNFPLMEIAKKIDERKSL